jgi:hypothetical protein
VSDAVLVGLIASVPATITAAAALWATIHGNRKVDALSIHINGRMEQLLSSVGKENLAVGKAAGVEEERERTA